MASTRQVAEPAAPASHLLGRVARRLSFGRAALALALLAALHGLVYVPLVSSNVGSDSPTYIAAAKAIDRGSYTTPLSAGFYWTPHGRLDITDRPIGRDAWSAPERQTFRPPGYPLLLAAVGGGAGGASRVLALLVQVVLFGAGTWLLALTVRRWWGPGPALLAAALYAFDPYSKHYVALLLTETLAAFLVLASAYAFTRAWHERSEPWWAAAGLLVAALTLVRAVFVLTIPLLLIAAFLRSGSAAARLRRLVAVALCAVALLTPWLVWSSAVTGKVALATWGEGYNALLAAHGEGFAKTSSEVQAEPSFRRDIASAHRLAPSTRELIADPEAHPRYLVRADARLRHHARSLYAHRLEHEPQQVVWETAYRAYFLWNAHEDWFQPTGALLVPLRVMDWLGILLGVAGAALAIARGGAARAVALFVLLYTLVLATHHVEARFAMPVRGLFFALVTLALLRLASAGRRLLTRVDVEPRGGNAASRAAPLR